MNDYTVGGYGLVGLDYWRLSDELSVIDAAFLTLSLDPGYFEFSMPAHPASSKIFRVGDFEEWESRALHNGDIDNVELEPNQFRAVFKAIRNAILGNKLRANVVTQAPKRRQADGYCAARQRRRRRTSHRGQRAGRGEGAR